MKEHTSDSGGALVHIVKVAEQLGLSEYQARGLVEKGELPATKVGRRIYVPARAVTDYLDRIGRAS